MTVTQGKPSGKVGGRGRPLTFAEVVKGGCGRKAEGTWLYGYGNRNGGSSRDGLRGKAQPGGCGQHPDASARGCGLQGSVLCGQRLGRGGQRCEERLESHPGDKPVRRLAALVGMPKQSREWRNCRYGAQCRYLFCPFKHPERCNTLSVEASKLKACWFGKECRYRFCPFQHPMERRAEPTRTALSPSDEVVSRHLRAPVTRPRDKRESTPSWSWSGRTVCDSRSAQAARGTPKAEVLHRDRSQVENKANKGGSAKQTGERHRYGGKSSGGKGKGCPDGQKGEEKCISECLFFCRLADHQCSVR